jgi:hypothetical protein
MSPIADEALELMGNVRGDYDTRVCVPCIETLIAAGDRARARDVATAARERMERRAARIEDPAWRASYLGKVAENARLIELAKLLES